MSTPTAHTAQDLRIALLALEPFFEEAVRVGVRIRKLVEDSEFVALAGKLIELHHRQQAALDAWAASLPSLTLVHRAPPPPACFGGMDHPFGFDARGEGV